MDENKGCVIVVCVIAACVTLATVVGHICDVLK